MGTWSTSLRFDQPQRSVLSTQDPSGDTRIADYMELMGDPYQSEFPELIEDTLSLPGRSTAATVAAFNRKGNLLAVGSSDGKAYIWDFETRGIARTLTDGGHMQNCGVTALSWSRNGKRLLTASTDWQVMLWGAEKAVVESCIVFDAPVLHAQLHPRNDELCLAVLVSDSPYLVDLKTKERKSIFREDKGEDKEKKQAPKTAKKGGMQNQALYAVSFDLRGEKIYAGNNKGLITVIDTATLNVLESIQVQGNTGILSIHFAPKGDFFLLNAVDRVIRVYETKTAALINVFQDLVNRHQWRKCVFSWDGEHVIGAQVSSHDIYIWSRAGQLMKMLEGPKEGIMDLVWHPSRPIIASCSTHGTVYVWATNYMYFQNWSAFAPDFTELEENEEYIEREDEFDAADDEDAKLAKKRRAEDQNALVDVIAVDKQGDVSDDDSELFFLPAKPIADRELESGTTAVPAAASQDTGGTTIVEDPLER